MLKSLKIIMRKGHVLKGGVESWSGEFKTPSWSVVYDFSVDVFCKLGIDQ
jgi:hypothetical protein